jgi:glycosyltransferase involved in cell wall biosynthesis
MIFNYLKYVSPVWYFNLKPTKDFIYFPSIEDLRKENFHLPFDESFLSEEGRKRDLAYRAFQLGFISKSSDNKKSDLWKTPMLPPEDEYRFLRKNFNSIWSVYVLIVRLLEFKNPYFEIKGFLKSKNCQRQYYHLNPVEYHDYANYQSYLLNKKPLISIVIPTLNRYKYLKDVFHDLEKQTYQNFEVIVVDQTDNYNDEIYQGWNFELRHWFQSEKALWKARNEAIQASKGEYILLYDDDSLIDFDWIEQHIKALDYFNADLSSGVSISTVGAKVPTHYSYFRWSDQLDTGNVLLKKEIFEVIGLFDTKFEKQRMGDGEFGLRAYLAGYRNISNPLAKRIHLKVGEGGLRQMGSWDGWRPKKFFGPRPVPSILYLFRKYHGNSAARWLMLSTIPFSLVPYRFKGNKYLTILGAILALLILPVVLCQVIISWQMSSRMLNER